MTDGSSRSRRTTPTSRPSGSRAGRRRGAAPGPRGLPRPRQRSRPDRVGRLHQRDASRRGRRRHHDHRHAAQQHPADLRPPGARAEAQDRPAPGVRRHRLLGRRDPGQRPRTPPAPRGRRLRLQVLPAALGRRRVPAAGPAPSSRTRWREISDVRRAADRARRGRSPDRPAPRRRTAPAIPRSCAPARAWPRTPPSPKSSSSRAGRAAASTSCTSPAPRSCRSSPRARDTGVRITAETCPHYLTFTAEEIPDGATQYKCCPPIREAANRELLWEGLRDGTIDMVVSDHSPSTIDLKHLDTGDFGTAWGGIASLQLGLPAVWTEARRRGFTLTDVARWMSAAPAAQIGLRDQGPDRGRLRRRLLRPRPRRVLRRRREDPAAQERHHAVRRTHARRRRPAAPGSAANPSTSRRPRVAAC